MSEEVREAVSIRTHFERFPATVKGAFVIRGDDPNRNRSRSGRAPWSRTSWRAPASWRRILDVPRTSTVRPVSFRCRALEPGLLGTGVRAEGTAIHHDPAASQFVVPCLVVAAAARSRGGPEVGVRGVEIGSLSARWTHQDPADGRPAEGARPAPLGPTAGR